jgi:hypothetical protein
MIEDQTPHGVRFAKDVSPASHARQCSADDVIEHLKI